MTQSTEKPGETTSGTIGKPGVPGKRFGSNLVFLKRAWRRISWWKIGLFIISLFIFILALTLMKEGARGLEPLLQGRLALNSPANSMGFGWLFAYAVMSGSPVAASALTFLDSGLIDQLAAFTMISGSRLGSSLVVLIIGFLYVLRGRNRDTSLSVGLLSFSVTGSLHIGVLITGPIMLATGFFEFVHLQPGGLLDGFIDAILNPIIFFIAAWLPDWGLFFVGLLIILASFSLFDKCVPQMTLQESQFSAVSRVVYRPMIMFFLGGLITLLSMSVSVSLSILVPLSQRGFVRRENIIPYIMGANVTTFIDTLFAAVLLDNGQTVAVVMAQMVGVALVSTLIMLTFFRRYERLLLVYTTWVTANNRNLVYFMIVIIALPIILMLL